MTRILAALAFLCALGLSWMALRQSASATLREDEEATAPSHHGTHRTGRWVRSRGFVPDDNRASWGGFRGGGPGFGK